ncbi:MAG: radical SAM protein [Planctomycetota bacterium]|jgi:MoaA/NifB/PqqE/SkfB family radical SAM enzyme
MTPPEDTATDTIDEHLLGIRPQEVLFELSTRCNLRCIYCAVSQPDYVGRDLEVVDRDALVEQLVALGPETFQINGHGESTLVEGWVDLARALLERGLAITVISHLNKPMTDEEIDTMARFERITVSCDTSDADVYRRLRRGGLLERVERNIKRILTSADRDGRPRPYISFNCTVSHINVLGIPELVSWAADLGLPAVALTNLEEYPPIEGVEQPLHPSRTDPVGGLAAVRRGREIAEERGLDYWVMGGLEEVLEEACEGQPAS